MTNSRPLLLLPQSTGADAPEESALHPWAPEAQLVGALMHLSVAQVAPLLKLVPDSAIRHHDNRWALEVIRAIVAGGDDPDPVVVLHTARRRPPTDAAQPDQPVTAARHHQFAVHLANLYTQVVTPAAVRNYAREVLEDTYRHTVESRGLRLADLAQAGGSRAELDSYLTETCAALADLWRRIDAIAE